MRKMVERKRVVRQEWIQSGLCRDTGPCGYSLHLTMEDLKRFTEAHMDSLPYDVGFYDWYTKPSIWRKPRESYVGLRMYQQLVEAREQGKYGLRLNVTVSKYH